MDSALHLCRFELKGGASEKQQLNHKRKKQMEETETRSRKVPNTGNC